MRFILFVCVCLFFTFKSKEINSLAKSMLTRIAAPSASSFTTEVLCWWFGGACFANVVVGVVGVDVIGGAGGAGVGFAGVFFFFLPLSLALLLFF
jgi:hypothetical protein